MRLRVWSSLVLPLALALAPASARAEQRDPAAAQALFDEALALMKKGRHAEACPKLTESQRLDPGVGTQFHLADCLENVGRIASAWALFLEVESVAKASGQPDRERVATARAQRLEPRLPRLRIEVPSGRSVPGLEVVRDGVVVGSAQWGTPIPVDPGKHELVSNAPGRKSAALEVVAVEGQTVIFEVPELAPAESSDRPAASEPKESSESAESGGRPTALILGVGAVGIVGVGVGAAFGVMARSDYQASKAACRPDNPNLCSAAGVAERNQALNKGNVATIAFAVGGVALAGAAVLWLVTDDSKQAGQASLRAGIGVEPGGASLRLGGAF